MDDHPAAALLKITELWSAMLSARGKGGLTTGGKDHSHHLIPQMLREQLGAEVDKFTVALAKRLHERLHTGKGFGRGGIWNGLWVKFMGNKGMKPTEKELQEFLKRITNLFGLDELPQRPFRK